MTASRKPNHALIINAYSFKNAGDAAIMLSTARLMRDLGARTVELSTRYDDAPEYARFGVPVISALIPFPARQEGEQRAIRAARALYYLAAALICCIVAPASRPSARRLATLLIPTTREIVGRYDTLVIAGGGYMYSSKRTVNLSLWHSLITIRFGQIFTDEAIMMPQSIGPVTRRLDARLLRWALARVTVVARETLSLERSLPSVKDLSVRIVDDVAFIPGVDVRRRATGGENVVRIVTMDWRWSTSVSADAMDRYIRTLAGVADRLTQMGKSVVLGGHSALPEHDQDDVAIAHLVASQATCPVEVDPDCSVDHLYEAYSQCSLVIGTRLHSCIMAISVGTPAIALAYQEKSRGVLELAGIPDAVTPVDTVDQEYLINLATHFMEAPADQWTSIADVINARIRMAYMEMLK